MLVIPAVLLAENFPIWLVKIWPVAAQQDTYKLCACAPKPGGDGLGIYIVIWTDVRVGTQSGGVVGVGSLKG